MDYAISVKNLTKKFKSVTAVDNISFVAKSEDESRGDCLMRG